MHKNSIPIKETHWNFEKHRFRGPWRFAIIKNTRQDKQQNQTLATSKTQFLFVQKLITNTK